MKLVTCTKGHTIELQDIGNGIFSLPPGLYLGSRCPTCQVQEQKTDEWIIDLRDRLVRRNDNCVRDQVDLDDCPNLTWQIKNIQPLFEETYE